MQNVWAHTATGANYPEYISVNMDGDSFRISVRSPRAEDGSEGPTATITLDGEKIRELAWELQVASGA